MQILNRLGGLPLARAYRLIKAIGKKKHNVIRSESDTFTQGCVEKGISQAKAQELFELIQRFAGYGFNKSHSTQYAILAFQTGYFKRYYPTEFMAALLTFEMGSTDKVAEYIEECRQMSIEVLPPDVNESFADFTVIYNNPAQSSPKKSSGDKTKTKGKKKSSADKPVSADSGEPDKATIRFGLAAVKGVGLNAVEEIIRVRQELGHINSLYDLCQNIDSRMINRGALEALIKAGALDSLGGNRAQLLAALDDAIAIGNKLQQDRQMGQMTLFDSFDSDDEVRQEAIKLPEVAPWPESLMLQYEKDVLGLYVTSHPLAQYAEQIHYYSTANSQTLRQKTANTEIIIGGILSRMRYCVTKNGRGAGSRMAMFTLEDLHGTVDGVIFPDALALHDELMQKDRMVFLRGIADFRREEPSIRVSEVYDMTRAAEELTHAVYVQMPEPTGQKLQQFKNICQTHPGSCPVYIAVNAQDGMQVTMQIAGKVKPDLEFCRKLEALIGHKNYRLLRPHDTLQTAQG
jgi:DNA polymerase-3 subunit alpha